MARIRTLKPEFFRSKKLARCSVAARLTYQGLWCEADDHGRGEAEPRVLAGAIWPLDDDIGWQEVDAHLDELAAVGCIVLYVVDGDRYYEIPSWEDHQSSAYRRGKAVHPASSEATNEHTLQADACKDMQSARVDVLELGTGNWEGNGEPGTGIAPKTARASDPIWDALIAAWNLDGRELTQTERARINNAAGQLRAIDADPAEIPARKQMFQVQWPDVTPTILAVVGRWAECRPDPSRLPNRAPRAVSSIARAVAGGSQ